MAQAQGWTVVPEPAQAPAGWTPVSETNFKAESAVDAAGHSALDPLTMDRVGEFGSHLWSQINPIAAVQTLGNAILHPVNTTKAIGAAQGAVYDKAKAAYDKGDYLTAARHFVDYMIPLVGPAIDKSSDLFQAGHWAAGGGDALGIGLAMFGPKAISEARMQARGPLLTNPNPEAAAAVKAGQAAGVPVDVATASGNRFVRGVQKLADESLGGSVVAQKAQQATGQAMAKWGDTLAETARETSITPEQAGQGVRDALASKIQAHTAVADRAYETLRGLEEQPTNRMNVALPQKMPVDLATENIRAQMRRIVHELDAMPFTPRRLQETGVGSDLAHVPGTGGAGAMVFDDIFAQMDRGTPPTRGVMQNQLENWLAGGPETPIVKAALEVADARKMGQGRPQLPPSAMEIPTRLESGRVTSREMGFPVDLTAPKMALRPVYDQLKRQMPVTQQQASYGLKAIENILSAPDFAPLSQVDQDLGAIKALAREHGGVAKLAVQHLEKAVQTAAQNGGPDVVQALETGRRATVAKVGTQALSDVLPGGPLQEPLAVFKRATAPKDAGIEFLRAINEHAPQTMPQLARAKLEDLLAMGPDKAYGEWSKLGAETKRTLYPQTGQTQTLEHFFTLGKRLAENPNPSGTALTLWKGGELTALVTNPLYGVPYSLGMATISKLLHSPRTASALTKVITVSVRGGAAATQSAALADLVKAAEAAGVVLPRAGAMPLAADQSGQP